MSPEECYDRIRVSLSDETGVLCFESLGIVDAPECRDAEQRLRAYLLGRPLAEVDLDHLRGLKCAGDGACMHAVIRVVEEYQHLFVGAGKGR